MLYCVLDRRWTFLTHPSSSSLTVSAFVTYTYCTEGIHVAPLQDSEYRHLCEISKCIDSKLIFFFLQNLTVRDKM